VSEASGEFSIGSTVWPGTSKVIEEMGELGQVLGKLIGLGGGTEHWDGTDLRERLVEEIGDVIAALKFWQAKNLLPAERIAVGQRSSEKVHLFQTWHAQQVREDTR
jgi:hypothetical protein